MRLLMIFMLAGFLQVSAKGTSQTITLSVKKAPIEKVFKTIEQQTGYTFIIFKKDLEKIEPVTLKLSNASLQMALDLCFEGQPFTWTLDDKNIIVKAKPETPVLIDLWPSLQQVYHGIIRDPSGKPMAGVNIQIKHTPYGTISLATGTFTINANAGDVLVISAIGYETQEITLGKNSALVINLKIKTSVMDSAVVTIVNTGYQTMPRERATGSFGYVNSRELDKQIGVADITEKFQSLLPGVLMNGGQPLVRGKSSMAAEPSPLVVIDGFASELGYGSINPNDVESITVLRDAAAASIWGARASNGVIVITTKQAKKSGTSKPVFNFTSTYKMQPRPDISTLKLANAADFVDFEIEALDKNWFNTTNPEKNNGYSRVWEIYSKRKQGLITEEEANKQYGLLKQNDSRSQEDLFFRTGIWAQQNLSIAGATPQNRYYISLNYQNNKTNSRRSGYDRMNLFIKNSYQIIPSLRFDADLNLAYSKGESNGIALSTFTEQKPYEMFVDANGNYVPRYGPYVSIQRNEQLMQQGYLDFSYNTKRELDNQDKTWNSFSPRINFSLYYSLTKSLSFESKFQYERNNYQEDEYSSLEIWRTRKTINDFTVLTNGKPENQIPRGTIYTPYTSNMQSTGWRNQGRFEKEWDGTRHRVSVIAGTELLRTITNTRRDRYHNYDKNRLTWTAINEDELAKGVTGFEGFITYPVLFQPIEEIQSRQFSVYSSGSYTFDDRYTISASGRIDKSNLFGASTNDKMTPLYSFGLAWNISSEKFFHAEAINMLRLRATTGLNGNLERSTSKVLVGIPGTDGATGEAYLQIKNPANNKLRWESTRSTNFGIDLGLLKSRITMTADYYIKRSFDLLGNIPSDPSLGFDKVYKNTAAVDNRGIDINITALVLNKGDFGWTSTLNVSYNRNKVTKVYNSSINSIDNHTEGGKDREIEGKPIDYFYSLRWAGLDDKGDPMIYNDKGEKMPYSATASIDWLVYSGSTLPSWYGAITNTFSWKGFSLTPIFSFQFGAKMRTPTSYMTANSTMYEEIARRWRKPGDEKITDVPRVFTSYNEPTKRRQAYMMTDNKVASADLIRLNSLSLFYDLPQRSTRGIFRNVQLQVQGTNLLLWTKNDLGIDPDAINRRFGTRGLPAVKTVTFGLKLDF